MSPHDVRRLRGLVSLALWAVGAAVAVVAEDRAIAVGFATFAGANSVFAYLALALPYKDGW